MQQRYFLTFLLISCLILISSCSSKNLQSDQLKVDESELANWMSGTFNSYRQAQQDTDYYNINLRMLPIWEDRTDGKWLYVEQAIASMQDRPYRQRVYHIQKTDKYSIESVVYRLDSQARFIQAHADHPLFEKINPDSLKIREGCKIVMTKSAKGYVGSTVEKECASNLRGASYATSEVVITENAILSWDRGYDAQDEQVWGAVKSGYLFEKIDPLALPYPISRIDDVVEVLHGKEVADPYRWLEDDNALETKDWVNAQNALTDAYLSSSPHLYDIRKRMTELWNYEKRKIPFQRGEHFFQYRNDGLQSHNVLFKMATRDGDGEVFLDPNTFSDDGSVSLSNISFSRDNKYLAYSTSTGGSDWREYYVMDVDKAKKLDDHLQNIKFSDVSWYNDGFFYGRYMSPEAGTELSGSNEYRKIYYHKVGTPQSEDILVYEDTEHPQRSAYVSVRGNILLLFISEHGKKGNKIYYCPVSTWENPNFLPLINEFGHRYNIVYVKDDWIYVKTDRDAPNGCVKRFHIDHPEYKDWQLVLPEAKFAIRSLKMRANYIMVEYLEDVKSVAYIYKKEKGKERISKDPRQSSVSYQFIAKTPERAGIMKNIQLLSKSKELYYQLESFLQPPSVFVFNWETQEEKAFFEPEVDFNFEDYETTQIFYASKDSTLIPMYITAKKGLVKDHSNPVLLYGYGGFNISRIPEFKVELLPFYEAGGVYVTVNLRGGSEYGEEWHQAGMQLNKQNVFDDYITAAEFLIDQGYTSPNKLAGIGRSNGGLLIGAVMNQRPELFRAALPVVGVMDMLRYEKFTIGWAWATEYGSASDSTQFENLYSYSPYHNIKEGLNYPATYIITAERDDRVVPAHSYKYAARLQAAYEGDRPMLIRIDKGAGHKSGRTTAQKIKDWSDRWAFLIRELDMKK